MKRYSILHDMQNCYKCGTNYNLEKHEIYYGQKHRNKSIEHGLVVALCIEHHRGTTGVHGRLGAELNTFLKKEGQMKFGNDEVFIKIFGRNYLE